MASTPEPVRWGILGTGGINRKILGGAGGTTAVEIVAVASRTQERAQEYAAEHGIPVAHGSYEALLADPSIEAVYISLPNALHHPWTMKALAAGKHVLCEKPYSSDPSEVDAAFDAADAAGLVLSEAFMWRHHPQVEGLRAVIPEIGGLEFVRSTFSFVLDGQVNIRLLRDLAGGSLMDVGCYCVSAARFLVGEEPVSVYGVAVMGSGGVDVRFTGMLEFRGGVTASFVCGFEAEHRGVEIIGPGGSAILTDPWHAAPAVMLHAGRETRFPEVDSYTLELEDISGAIRDRRPPLLGRADALGQARTIGALLRSAESGSPVRL
jgi:predicted dehydrogenase